jgi:hypothetical protein
MLAGCGPRTENGNANASNNANTTTNTTADNANASSITPLADPCNEGNINDRLAKVDQKIKDKIKNSSLNDQYIGGTFKYQLVIGPGTPGNSIDMFVEGAITGKDQFPDFVGIVKTFAKAKCTQKVTFVKSGTLPVKQGSMTGGVGFDWVSGCDYPNVACPGGECLPACTTVNPTPPPVPPANSNSSHNSNTPGNKP